MRSMFSMRAWLGPQIQMQSISGAATISSMERERARLPDAQGAGQGGRLFRVSGLRAPDAAHVRVADGDPGLDVESGDEAAADEPDAETASLPLPAPPGKGGDPSGTPERVSTCGFPPGASWRCYA